MMGRRNTPDLLASSLLEYPFAQPVRSRKRKAPRKPPQNDTPGAEGPGGDGHGSRKDVPGRVTPAERPKSGYRIPGERRSKNILFYRNGDKFFKGKKVRITPHRYLTFTELLNDLTKSVSLPYGVRKVYTPEGEVIENIDDLQDGKAYVCASFERFKQLNYGSSSLPDWSSNTRKPTRIESKYPISRLSLGYSYPPTGKYASSYSQAKGHGGRSVPGSFTYHGQRSSGDGSTRVFGKAKDQNGFKPRLVKFIKYGAKPRKVVSILLNKRTVFSFEHLLNEITDAFDLPVHKNQRIRKLYTTKGKEIRGVSDFFRETESFFIAATSRQPLLKVEIQDILDELLPSNPNLTLEPAKPRRKFKDRDSKSDSGVEADGPGDTPTKSASADLPPLDQQSKDEPEVKTKIKAWATQEEREEDERRIAVEEKRRKEEAIRRKKEEAEQKAKEEEERRKEEERRLQEAENKRKRREEELKVELARKEEELKAKEEELRRKEEEAKRREEEEKKRKEEERKERKRKKEEKRKKDEERKKREEEKKKEEEERKQKEEERKRKEEEERKEKEKKEDEEKKELERKRLEEVKKEEERRKKEKRKKEKEKKEEERKKKEEKKKEEERQKKEVEEQLNAKDNSIEPDSIEELTVKETRADDENDSRFDLPAEDSLVLSETSEIKLDLKQDKIDLKQDDQRKESKDDKHQESIVQTKTNVELTDNNTPVNRFKPAPREIVHKNVVLEKYDVGKKIGDGNFAEVHKATLKSSGEAFAMKIVYKSKLKGKEHMIANEIGIMHNINHENIVRLYEEYETKNHIYLLMEFVSGGDLFDAITESIKFTEADGSQIIGDMARALKYLHDLNVVHRDLKPENLLVSKSSTGDIRVKLADFGLAMEVLEPIYTVCGTPTYVAPEILAETGYGLEVDMWATGVITYILLCGFPPFRSLDRDQEELFELIQAGQFEYLSPYWDNISFDAKDMINHLLVVNPKRRFKAYQILRHPWIMNHNKSDDLPNLQREVSMNLEMNFEGRRSANKGRVKEAEH